MKIRFLAYHILMRRKGIYTLATRSAVRLLIVVAIVAALLIIAQSQINDLDEIVNAFLQKWDAPFVLSLFFTSETLLGLIPPDFFIIWCNSTPSPIAMLMLLAILSYLGGLTAYYIGSKVAAFPKVKAWLIRKYSSHFATFHKYGGFLIIFSALFPLPFSTITMVSGMLEYPFRKVVLLGLFRLLRFALYALVLFQVF